MLPALHFFGLSEASWQKQFLEISFALCFCSGNSKLIPQNNCPMTGYYRLFYHGEMLNSLFHDLNQ